MWLDSFLLYAVWLGAWFPLFPSSSDNPARRQLGGTRMMLHHRDSFIWSPLFRFASRSLLKVFRGCRSARSSWTRPRTESCALLSVNLARSRLSSTHGTSSPGPDNIISFYEAPRRFGKQTPLHPLRLFALQPPHNPPLPPGSTVSALSQQLFQRIVKPSSQGQGHRNYSFRWNCFNHCEGPSRTWARKIQFE